MAVDPNIKKKADDIRNKVYGKEVRESLASGLEAMSTDVVENEGRQDSVESQWQVVSDEMTDKDVISAPEIIAARNGEANLKTRIDKDHQEVTAQLAQIPPLTRTIKFFDNPPHESALIEGEIGLIRKKENNVIAHYKFNDVEGDIITDYSGNGRHITSYGSEIVDSLREGKSRKFNGVDAYAKSLPTNLLGGLKNLKVEVIFSVDKLLLSGAETLVSTYRDVEGDPTGFYINYGGTHGVLGFTLRIAPMNLIAVDYDVSIDTLYKLVLTYDGVEATGQLLDLSGNVLSEGSRSYALNFQNKMVELFLGNTKSGNQFASFTIDELVISTW